MTLKVKKQDKETTQSLVRRFQKSVQQSGILFKVRRNRFHKRTQSDTAKKKVALRKEELKKEYAKLKKLGKI
jgi:ribosomal protein S21